MTIAVLDGAPTAQLAAALGRFEPAFSYPLGADERFHVEHGGDCWRFFHALGDAAYAVERDRAGAVRGTLGAALRRVLRPDGGETALLYLGDLKIAAAARGGLVLIQLMRAIRARFADRTGSAFAVVMDGTSVTPAAYTGRLGIPAFAAVDAQAILSLRTAPDAGRAAGVARVGAARGRACCAALARGRYHAPHGEPAQRSQLEERWLVAGEGAACGRLEDTLRAKRLRTTRGEELRSAHLSCFAYRRLEDGLAVLDAALAEAAQAGYPLLFVAVAGADAPAVRAARAGRLRTCATATVFASGPDASGPWLINTAEI